jgi:hypothetical protein
VHALVERYVPDEVVAEPVPAGETSCACEISNYRPAPLPPPPPPRRQPVRVGVATKIMNVVKTQEKNGEKLPVSFDADRVLAPDLALVDNADGT